MNNIQHIIFDFGGVLYDIDPQRTMTRLAALSADKRFLDHVDMGTLYHHKAFLDYEKGLLSSAGLRSVVRGLFQIAGASDSEIDDAWNATLIAPFEGITETMRQFSAIAPIYLLSNTNELHRKMFSGNCGELLSLFAHCFYSYELKMRKPEAAIFEYVLDFLGSEPGRVLFVDDMKENTDAAARLGFATYHLGPGKKLSDLLHSVK